MNTVIWNINASYAFHLHKKGHNISIQTLIKFIMHRITKR